jgi:hypothetical protein
MFTIRAMKTYPSAQTLGFFDVELRYIGRRSRSRGTEQDLKPGEALARVAGLGKEEE